MKVDCQCPFCGKIQTIVTNPDAFAKWKNGEMIQKAMPFLSASDREALMTGICDDCFPSNDGEDHIL